MMNDLGLQFINLIIPVMNETYFSTSKLFFAFWRSAGGTIPDKLFPDKFLQKNKTIFSVVPDGVTS
jgi:hypothetical protein